MLARLAVLLVLALTVAACGQNAPDDPAVVPSENAGRSTTGVLASGPRTAAADSAVALFAVGDIGDCGTRADDKVARFLRERTARIATLGDTVYDAGTPEEFADCFDPAWGPMRDRIYPTVGNHEYATAGAQGYFDYFGDRAGTSGRGWYAYNLGDHWRAIVLNSQCSAVGGCGSTSPQGRWLAGALERAGNRNVIAYFHAPRYSSGKHGPTLAVRPLFRALYRARADIVLSGHDHSYERFAPQNAVGDRRPHGVQQFVVGTGGRALYPFERRPLANTRARNDTTYGVLRLALRRHGYSWKFIPVVGSYTDSGKRSLD